ncbi:retrovirus-related pol polyprotein from transposon TNT 1-94 [Tanacetum coccineum]
MMSFLTAVVTSGYPTTNNQLRTSSNPRQQATIYDGKVTVQPVQGKQTIYVAGTTRKYTPGATGNNTGKQRTVICYNCKGEGHIAKQCTKPKRKRDETWFNDKVLLKARESKPKLYDGNTILKMDTIVIPDSDETLMLCEESRSKLLLKEQDPMVVKHRVNTKPINYDVLNNDYYKRFVRQSNLYSEHAYWKATSVPALDPSHSSTTVIVEVPKELPKVSMVNTSLKELKRYLTGFDQVVKERTTATAIFCLFSR